jgi:mono/diheme cytochrome c family protein
MKQSHQLLWLGLALAAATSPALAQVKGATDNVESKLNQILATQPANPGSKTDTGRLEFENSCATCHGTAGKGMGPFSDSLKRSPPDLTTLAKRNGGVLPLSRIYSTIEGVEGSHGTREMPIWGRRYRLEAAVKYDSDVGYNEALIVRGRILNLVDYLNRIQEK